MSEHAGLARAKQLMTEAIEICDALGLMLPANLVHLARERLEERADPSRPWEVPTDLPGHSSPAD